MPGIVSDSTVSVQKAEANLYAALVGDTLAMKIGSGSWSPDGDDWTLAASGNRLCGLDQRDPYSGDLQARQTAVAGESLTVTYKGTLTNSSVLTLRWGYDSYQGMTDTAMTKTE